MIELPQVIANFIVKCNIMHIIALLIAIDVCCKINKRDKCDAR